MNITVEEQNIILEIPTEPPINVVVSEEAPIGVIETFTGPPGPPGPLPDMTDLDKIGFDLAGADTSEGQIAWDADAGTIKVGMPGGNVTLQVGQENIARVRNRTGITIPNGTVVYISGATGHTPEISPASASDFIQSTRTIAMATEDIPNNNSGYVTTFGIVRDVNTSAIIEGAIIYLGEVAGTYTPTPPAYPANKVCVGICIYQHAIEGKIFFFPKMLFQKFGGVANNNYSGIDDEGHIINYGSAMTWNDLPPIPLLVQRAGNANQPTLATLIGNIQQLTFGIGDYLYGNYELLHEYAEGTDISPHIHMVTNGSDTTDRYVQWELEYTIANADATAPYTSAFPTTQIITAEVMIPANTPSRSHIIVMQFPEIPGTDLRIGAYILWRLRRIAASGTAPSNEPFGLTMGFHVLQNTQGSDTTGRKNIGAV